MKSTSFSLTLLSLFRLSVGQPRHHHHQHAHKHGTNKDAIQKRDKITITDSTRTAATEMPEVVIYVDQNNNPIRTTTETVVYVPVSSETEPAPAPQTSTVEVPPVPTTDLSVQNSSSSSLPQSSSSAPKHVSTWEPIPIGKLHPTSPKPAPPPSTSSSPPSSTPPTSSTSLSSSPSASPSPPTSSNTTLHGVTYSPYKGGGGCKTAEDVDADFALVAREYGVIRLYGVDCDQVATAYAAAKKHGNKLFLGIFDINSVQDAVSTMAAGVNNDWSVVDTVSVGNELVNNGGASVDESLDALNQARTALRAAGYQGPVVIVDTFVAMLAHPELCDQSDYCAANVHPFFDPNTGADQAGSFLTSTVSNIRSKLSDPDKRIVVTETGWPWQGESNGAAIPGMDQQSAALSSIKDAFTNNAQDVILFTAFNDLWKKPAAATFMAEQFWGMGGRYSPCDE
ncbi:glycoside hydrolase family 17 protein [Hypoxylon sp. CI-4A]|nr:glycoside hydrolase family 17 protein [Hypoxylon sp. CI-4A]